MPSQTLKDALAGNETAFMQMLWNIENQKIEAKDLKFLTETLDKNTHGRCLTAALYIYGAPGFEKNHDTARKILDSILVENQYPYAVYLRASVNFFETNNQMIEMMKRERFCYEKNFHILNEQLEKDVDAGLKSKNPLTQLMFLTILPNEYCIHTPDYERNGSTSSSLWGCDYDPIVINSLKDIFENLASSYRKLENTAYKQNLNRAISHIIENEIPQLFKEYLDNYQRSENFNILHVIHKNNPPHKLFGNFWMALANYGRDTGQRKLMFNALQHAADLNPKKKKEWLSAFSNEDLTYSNIEKYLQSFIEMIKITGKRIPTASEGQLSNVIYNLNIEFKNCQLLTDYAETKFPLEQSNKIKKLFDKCDLYKQVIERDVNQRLPKKEDVEDRQALKR